MSRRGFMRARLLTPHRSNIKQCLLNSFLETLVCLMTTFNLLSVEILFRRCFPTLEWGGRGQGSAFLWLELKYVLAEVFLRGFRNFAVWTSKLSKLVWRVHIHEHFSKFQWFQCAGSVGNYCRNSFTATKGLKRCILNHARKVYHRNWENRSRQHQKISWQEGRAIGYSSQAFPGDTPK